MSSRPALLAVLAIALSCHWKREAPQRLVVADFAGTALGLVFIALAVISDGMYALAAGSAAGWLNARRGFARTQRLVTGSVLVGLGLATAFSGAHRKN